MCREARPPNAFILFFRATRASIQEENPGLKNLDYTKIVAQRWKLMSEYQKHSFKCIAAELQRQFKKRNPNYSYKKHEKRSPFLRRQVEQTAQIQMEPPRSDPVPSSLPFPFRWESFLNHHDNVQE
jgi:hypothetical protein